MSCLSIEQFACFHFLRNSSHSVMVQCLLSDPEVPTQLQKLWLRIAVLFEPSN
jgi:hypothetical protein